MVDGQNLHPIDAFRKLIQDDAEYAWALHCNLAMPIMDATGVSHKTANETAAYLMMFLFDYDIVAHPNYQYGKSFAQECHEIRLRAEREEDALLAARQEPQS